MTNVDNLGIMNTISNISLYTWNMEILMRRSAGSIHYSLSALLSYGLDFLFNFLHLVPLLLALRGQDRGADCAWALGLLLPFSFPLLHDFHLSASFLSFLHFLLCFLIWCEHETV